MNRRTSACTVHWPCSQRLQRPCSHWSSDLSCVGFVLVCYTDLFPDSLNKSCDGFWVMLFIAEEETFRLDPHAFSWKIGPSATTDDEDG